MILKNPNIEPSYIPSEYDVNEGVDHVNEDHDAFMESKDNEINSNTSESDNYEEAIEDNNDDIDDSDACLAMSDDDEVTLKEAPCLFQCR